jgi:hypothetical protein
VPRKLLAVPSRIRARFSRVWVSLARRQRRALVLLGVANGIVLLVLVLLARAPSYEAGPSTSPLAPARLDACRQQISRALFDAGQTGAVQIRDDGVLIQLQRPTTLTTSLRLEADAATWAALEAMAVAGRGDCLGLEAVRIDVTLQPPDAEPRHATAHVALPDVLLWALGEIDDAELTQRLDYEPPGE